MQLGLIGNDSDNSDWLGCKLEAAGFAVHRIRGIQDAVGRAASDSLSAFMFDLAGSSAHAAEYVAPLRRAQIVQPLMVLSARSDWREKVECLDAGADDYIVKPVRSEEVAARLRAIIRRRAGGHSNRLELGDITLDLKASCAWLDARCLDLTRNEFRLLRLFLFHQDRALSHLEIRTLLYGPDTKVSGNAVEVQIARLRRKVGQSRIRTVRGVGYRYIPDAAEELQEAEDHPQSCAKGPVC
jgi:DNA-binding response OmpR family regulator